MKQSWFLDGRTDLRWWQHRHPDPKMRIVGLLLMGIGVVQLGIGLILLLR